MIENSQIPQNIQTQAFTSQQYQSQQQQQTYQNQLPRLLRLSQQQSFTPQKQSNHLVISLDNGQHIVPQQVNSFGSQKAKNKKGQQQQQQQQKYGLKKQQTAKSNPPNYDAEKLRKYKYYLALKGVKDKRYEEISTNQFQLAQRNEEIWNITQNQVERQRKEIENLRTQRKQQQYLNYPKQKYNHPGINDKSDQSLLEELQAETQINEFGQNHQILKEIGDILGQKQEEKSGEIKVMVDPSQLKYLFAE